MATYSYTAKQLNRKVAPKKPFWTGKRAALALGSIPVALLITAVANSPVPQPATQVSTQTVSETRAKTNTNEPITACSGSGYYTKDCIALPQTRVVGGSQWCSVLYAGEEINEGPCDSFTGQTLGELKAEADKYDNSYGSGSSFAEAQSKSLNKTIDANVKKGCYFDEKTGARKGPWNC